MLIEQVMRAMEYIVTWGPLVITRVAMTIKFFMATKELIVTKVVIATKESIATKVPMATKQAMPATVPMVTWGSMETREIIFPAIRDITSIKGILLIREIMVARETTLIMGATVDSRE